MKNLLFIAFIFILVYCENKDNYDVKNEISQEFSVQNFVGSKIAYKEKDKITLGITDKELLNSFNNYTKKIELGSKANSFELLTLEDKNYIRFYNEDGSVSTVALINKNKAKNDSQNEMYLLYIGGTVCTTTKCANCCGCVPDGDYCTMCEGDTDDCKRTTSSGG